VYLTYTNVKQHGDGA